MEFEGDEEFFSLFGKAPRKHFNCSHDYEPQEAFADIGKAVKYLSKLVDLDGPPIKYPTLGPLLFVQGIYGTYFKVCCLPCIGLFMIMLTLQSA